MSTDDTLNQLAELIPRRTLVALVNASQAINGETEQSAVFRRIVEQAVTVLDADGASVLLFDKDREELMFQTAVGPAGGKLEGERIKADQGIAGQVVQTRRAVRVDDVRENRNFFPGIDAKTNLTTGSLMAAPLLFRDAILGVLEVINPVGRKTFSDADLHLLQVFGNLAATAAAHAQAFERVSKQARGLRDSLPPVQLIGNSTKIQHLVDLARKVAPAKATILITGETGSGKEMFARLIHEFSNRREKPFIAINCAALPESLLESELFGHEKGAFTGATDRKMGRFELADAGTLFLDELGEMSHTIQVKLLRVLQEQEFVRVGGTKTVTCDVRIVAATNRDLKEDTDSGRFRSDLYYRLNVFPLKIPPLRDRIEDLPLLVDHFIGQVIPSLGVPAPAISDAALAALMRYEWPGNIRELRNVIERSTLLAGNLIEPEHLPPEIARAAPTDTAEQPRDDEPETHRTKSKLAEHERALICKALDDNNWNQSAAARQLGISRDNLRYRVKKYKLRKPQRR